MLILCIHMISSRSLSYCSFVQQNVLLERLGPLVPVPHAVHRRLKKFFHCYIACAVSSFEPSSRCSVDHGVEESTWVTNLGEELPCTYVESNQGVVYSQLDYPVSKAPFVPIPQYHGYRHQTPTSTEWAQS